MFFAESRACAVLKIGRYGRKVQRLFFKKKKENKEVFPTKIARCPAARGAIENNLTLRLLVRLLFFLSSVFVIRVGKSRGGGVIKKSPLVMAISRKPSTSGTRGQERVKQGGFQLRLSHE